MLKKRRFSNSLFSKEIILLNRVYKSKRNRSEIKGSPFSLFNSYKGPTHILFGYGL